MADRITGYKAYTTSEGDTFDALALAMYGDERLAHRIIRFNPDQAEVVVFGPNVRLKLPIYESAEIPGTLPPWRRGEEK